VFLLRNENTVKANIAAIKTELYGDANNEKLKLKTLGSFCWCKSSSNNWHNQFFTDWKRLKIIKKGQKRWKVTKKTTDFHHTLYFEKNHYMSLQITRSSEKYLGVAPVTDWSLHNQWCTLSNDHAGQCIGRYIFVNNSPTSIARELPKPSADAASLLGSI